MELIDFDEWLTQQERVEPFCISGAVQDVEGKYSSRQMGGKILKRGERHRMPPQNYLFGIKVIWG